MRHLSPSLTHGYGRAGPTKSTLSASDDAWRCQAPASCQSLDQQACATARSRSSRCMALSYLLLLVPKCVPWPTPVHTHRAAVGAARALLQVFRSLAAVCSPSIVAFDFGFSDRSFSATLCEKDNPERKPLRLCLNARLASCERFTITIFIPLDTFRRYVPFRVPLTLRRADFFYNIRLKSCFDVFTCSN